MRFRFATFAFVLTGLLCATSAEGLGTEGPASPTVRTAGVYGVSGSEVILVGRMDPNGPTTHWHFEVGTTRAYTANEPHTGTEDPFGGEGFVEVEEAFDCLAPRTRYHYRLVAVNGVGKTFGNDRTFRTKSQRGKGNYRDCPHGKPLR